MVALVAAGSCLPELQRIDGERFVYEHSTGLEPCGGTFAYMERASAFIPQQLGAPPSRVRYSWLTGEDELSLTGSRESEGKTAGAHAISGRPALVHELVHAAVTTASAPFFREGLAVAYDPLTIEQSHAYPLSEGGPAVVPDPRRNMSASSAADVDYGEAGLFVTFLLARYGPERFMRFYAPLRRPWTLARIEARFLDVYRVSLEDAVTIFRDRSRYPSQCDFNVQTVDCAAPVLTPQGEVWATAALLRCESDSVVGGDLESASWRNFSALTLEVEREGTYDLDVFGDLGAGVRLAACFGCPWSRNDVYVEAGATTSVALTKGRYYARMSAPAGEPLEIGFVLARRGSSPDPAK
jgi:hypothetical protein